MPRKITTKQTNQSKMLLVKRNVAIKITYSQPTFTCSKSTTETPEQGAKHAQN